MKTLLQTTAIGLALGFVATPAFADVFVFADITKDADIVVNELVTKTKIVRINVNAPLTSLAGAAEANAVANVTNDGNTVDAAGEIMVGPFTATGNPNNFLLQKHATITGSIDFNSGIVGVNQDVGNMVNQANIVSFAESEIPGSLTNSQADVSQLNDNNTVTHIEKTLNLTAPPIYTALIDGSIDNNTGIVGVNQNVGNMNNQTNAIALAVGAGALVALSEADLGQTNSNNHVSEANTTKSDLITASVNTNSGIVQVNQTTGNMNNQASVISISALTSRVVISP